MAPRPVGAADQTLKDCAICHHLIPRALSARASHHKPVRSIRQCLPSYVRTSVPIAARWDSRSSGCW